MYWFPFFILAYVLLGLQAGIGDHLRIGDANPNLVVLAVVFVCLNTTRDLALTASLLIGLLQDLVTSQPPGLYALSYGLTSLVMASGGRQAGGEHPVTHGVFSLLAQLVVGILVLLHSFVRLDGGGGLRPSWTFVLGSALYTAVVGVAVLGVLSKIRRVFGFREERANYAARGRA